MKAPPDLLVIGHSCVLAINRAVYRALMRDGFKVELVVPPQAPTGARLEERRADDPLLHVLTLKGRNLRYYRFEGLMALVRRLKPRLIHLENEPDTPLAFHLGRWAKKNGAVFSCQTLENALPPIVPRLLSGNVKSALRSLRTRASIAFNRPYLNLIFCHSQQAYAVLERLKLNAHARLLPLGFDETLFRSDPKLRTKTRERLGLQLLTIA